MVDRLCALRVFFGRLICMSVALLYFALLLFFSFAMRILFFCAERPSYTRQHLAPSDGQSKEELGGRNV